MGRSTDSSGPPSATLTGCAPPLRLPRYGVFLGDFRSVEELGKVLDVAALTDDPGQDPPG